MLITVLKYVINERICSTLHHHHHNHNSVPNDDAPPSPRPAALPTGKKAGGPRVTGACRSMNLVPIQFSKKDCQKKLPPKKCEKQKKQRWVKQNLHAKNPIKKKQTTWLPGGIGRDTSWAIDSDVPQWWCVVTLYPRVSVPTLRNGCCSEAQGCEASLLIITTV